jgi:hypothetical protein
VTENSLKGKAPAQGRAYSSEEPSALRLGLHTESIKMPGELKESEKCGKRLKSESDDGYASDGEVTAVTAAESEASEYFPNEWDAFFEDKEDRNLKATKADDDAPPVHLWVHYLLQRGVTLEHKVTASSVAELKRGGKWPYQLELETEDNPAFSYGDYLGEERCAKVADALDVFRRWGLRWWKRKVRLCHANHRNLSMLESLPKGKERDQFRIEWMKSGRSGWWKYSYRDPQRALTRYLQWHRDFSKGGGYE